MSCIIVIGNGFLFIVSLSFLKSVTILTPAYFFGTPKLVLPIHCHRCMLLTPCFSPFRLYLSSSVTCERLGYGKVYHDKKLILVDIDATFNLLVGSNSSFKHSFELRHYIGQDPSFVFGQIVSVLVVCDAISSVFHIGIIVQLLAVVLTFVVRMR